ncbi:uncharacterized protein LOC125545040 [Triticum urartu]|uniref:DUF4220 domain-containing protein n=1 Tax=Triticum urartu TaxID=4572 RepID=A0A8R7TY43_TRIUA|nr:uncharacterized protein LOC125545040 [Triticum urartu]
MILEKCQPPEWKAEMEGNGMSTQSMGGLLTVWNEWEIRVLVLTSLALQVFLLFSAGIRKRNVSALLSVLLWLAYLLADSIAIYALGYLSQTRVPRGACDDAQLLFHRNHRIQVFWAPFLLLHLGGQDTITAFSIEDNELWKRHLLSLLSQVALAVYVFSKSRPGADILYPAVFMFLSGILKYGERTWALKCASMDNLRSGMVTIPDPGPNYAKFMEEYRFTREAGLRAEIIIESERRAGVTAPAITEETVPYATVITEARRFFVTFKRLFVNLILSFQDRTMSQATFLRLMPEQAYKIIEIELSLMYDTLHSKAAVMHTCYGRLFRCVTLVSTTTACVFFNVLHKGRRGSYDGIDVLITNLLFGGALCLEVSAIGMMLVSYWTYAALKGSICHSLSHLILRCIKYFRPESRAKWSNLMAQHNLISFCLHDKPTLITKILTLLGLKGHWDSWLYIWHIDVSSELKISVFRELKDKALSIVDTESYRKFSNHRGQWALQCKGYYKELGWSVEAEFDESILLWHIATDLCFYSDDDNDDAKLTEYVSISRAVSNYMLFLLVARPFMLTAGIGQIRFGDTCAEAKNFFGREAARPDERAAARMVLEVNAEIAPRDVKGDRSKSVLFDACRLAKSLLELPPGKKWRLIRVVWVEMLCYAASKCRSNFHAKQLSNGGELLTVVWFLMTHLGMGEQYRIEAGHARAKLIV